MCVGGGSVLLGGICKLRSHISVVIMTGMCEGWDLLLFSGQGSGMLNVL